MRKITIYPFVQAYEVSRMNTKLLWGFFYVLLLVVSGCGGGGNAKKIGDDSISLKATIVDAPVDLNGNQLNFVVQKEGTEEAIGFVGNVDEASAYTQPTGFVYRGEDGYTLYFEVTNTGKIDTVTAADGSGIKFFYGADGVVDVVVFGSDKTELTRFQSSTTELGFDEIEGLYDAFVSELNSVDAGNISAIPSGARLIGNRLVRKSLEWAGVGMNGVGCVVATKIAIATSLVSLGVSAVPSIALAAVTCISFAVSTLDKVFSDPKITKVSNSLDVSICLSKIYKVHSVLMDCVAGIIDLILYYDAKKATLSSVSGFSVKFISSDTVELSWLGSESGRYYSVYYSEGDDNSANTRLKDYIKGTSYIHTGLTPGQTYHYRLRAIVEDGLETFAWSKTISIQMPETTSAQYAGLPAETTPDRFVLDVDMGGTVDLTKVGLALGNGRPGFNFSAALVQPVQVLTDKAIFSLAYSSLNAVMDFADIEYTESNDLVLDVEVYQNGYMRLITNCPHPRHHLAALGSFNLGAYGYYDVDTDGYLPEYDDFTHPLTTASIARRGIMASLAWNIYYGLVKERAFSNTPKNSYQLWNSNWILRNNFSTDVSVLTVGVFHNQLDYLAARGPGSTIRKVMNYFWSPVWQQPDQDLTITYRAGFDMSGADVVTTTTFVGGDGGNTARAVYTGLSRDVSLSVQNANTAYSCDAASRSCTITEGTNSYHAMFVDTGTKYQNVELSISSVWSVEISIASITAFGNVDAAGEVYEVNGVVQQGYINPINRKFTIPAKGAVR